MSAQLEQARPSAAARQPHPLRAAPRPAVRSLERETPVVREAPRPEGHATASPDRDPGLGLLYSFVGAAAVMVGDVLVVGAVARWWILIPGFVVLLAMTAIVFSGIMRLLADGGEAATRNAH